MMEVPIEMPSCMVEAWKLIEEDRAFVACLITEDEIRIVASKGTVTQLHQLPEALQFLSEETDRYLRASFLLAGVREVSTARPEPE